MVRAWRADDGAALVSRIAMGRRISAFLIACLSSAAGCAPLASPPASAPSSVRASSTPTPMLVDDDAFVAAVRAQSMAAASREVTAAEDKLVIPVILREESDDAGALPGYKPARIAAERQLAAIVRALQAELAVVTCTQDVERIRSVVVSAFDAGFRSAKTDEHASLIGAQLAARDAGVATTDPSAWAHLEYRRGLAFSTIASDMEAAKYALVTAPGGSRCLELARIPRLDAFELGQLAAERASATLENQAACVAGYMQHARDKGVVAIDEKSARDACQRERDSRKARFGANSEISPRPLTKSSP